MGAVVTRAILGFLCSLCMEAPDVLASSCAEEQPPVPLLRGPVLTAAGMFLWHPGAF